MINCRIVEIGDSFRILGPSAYSLPAEGTYLLKRLVKSKRLKKKDAKISAFDIFEAMRDKDDEDKPQGLDEIKKALEDKLKSIGIKIDLNDIHTRINGNTMPGKAFPEIYNSNLLTSENQEEVLGLVAMLWNNYPRKEFNGKSPNEKGVMGSPEKMFLRICMNEAMSKFSLEDYPNIADAEEAIEAFKQEWFGKPQKELNGKTPKEVIFEERENLGNPSKDITVQFKLEKMSDDA